MILIALVNLANSFSFTYGMCDTIFGQFISTDVPAWYNALRVGQYPGTQVASIPANDYLNIATAVLTVVAGVPELIPALAVIAPIPGVSWTLLHCSI
jgi:hypothetical protein